MPLTATAIRRRMMLRVGTGEHGNGLLYIAAHGMITEVDALNRIFGGGGQFPVIRGEEITSNFDKRSVHVNALSPTPAVDARRGSDLHGEGRRGLCPGADHRLGWEDGLGFVEV